MLTISDIKQISVLGAGTMGPGIAQSFAMAGYDVKLWTRSEETRDKAESSLRSQLETYVEEGELTVEEADQAFARVELTNDLEYAVKDADFIQETIVEKIDPKVDLYSKLVMLARKDAIIASNTSAMNIFEVVPEELLPRTIICHWYAPAQLIPLVEVVKSEQAPDEYAQLALTLLTNCGKTAVLMKKFIKGYIVNRLQQCLNREIFYLLDNGYCDVEAIDLASKASFIPRACVLGVCKRIDFNGLDMTANNYRNHAYHMPENGDEMPETLKAHVDKGEFGIKSGKGFYDYEGIDINELKAKRDKQLFAMFKLEKEFLDDPV